LRLDTRHAGRSGASLILTARNMRLEHLALHAGKSSAASIAERVWDTS
jgi:hypothetical protein